MAITYVDHPATAGQTEFTFTFDYLEDEHVKVFVDGVEQALTTNFTIDLTSTKKIVLSNPKTPLTGGEIVRVRRISDPATDLVDFQNGSVLTESELDRAYLHNRYLAEESAEQNDVSMRLTAGAVGWDGLTKRILNIVDPVNEQDVATKNYVDGVIGDVALGEVPDDSITYAKIQDAVGNNVLLGNDNGAGEEVQELNATEVRAILNVADGAEVNVQSDWNEADTNSDAFIQNKPIFVPTGTVSAFAGSAAPTGYALCDGSEVNRTTQAALFAVIGTTYGSGDGSTTFNLPDLRGRVIAGLDINTGGFANRLTTGSAANINGQALGSNNGNPGDTGRGTNGAQEHLLTSAESGLPDHTHKIAQQSNGNFDTGTFNNILTGSSLSTTGVVGGAQDASSAHNNVQPTIILNYIIKT